MENSQKIDPQQRKLMEESDRKIDEFIKLSYGATGT